MTTGIQDLALARAAKEAGAVAHILPSTFHAAVTRVEGHDQEYRRTAYSIESRTVRLGVATAHGTKKADIGPRPDPSRVDPWQVDPRTLSDSTRTVAVCPACEGTKKRTCETCGGVGQLRCGECGGGGRVAGQRGLKSCPSCRGKGTRRCTTCNGKGQNKCDVCDGLGRVRAWLEVETSRSTQVRAFPLTGPALLHGELAQASDLDRDPGLFPFPLVSDTGWGSSMPSGLEPELIVQLNPFTDRILARRLQVFRSTVFHCHYEILTGAGVVRVAGHPPQVLPESEWGPWQRRWLVALGVGVSMLVAMGVYVAAFVNRAEWFARQPAPVTIGTLGFVAAVLAGVAAAGYCLPRRARDWPRVRLPLAGVVGAWAWMLLLWIVVTPSPEGVRAAMQRGDLAAAEREAVAVEAVEGSSEDLVEARADLEAAEAEAERQRRQALDDEHLARVERARSVAATAAEVGAGWEFDATRQLAMEHLLRRADAELEALVERNDGDELRQLAETIARFDEARAARARSRSTLAEVAVCRRAQDYPCVVEALGRVQVASGDTAIASALEQAREGARTELDARLREPSFEKSTPMDERKRLLEALLEDAKAYETLTGRSSPLDEEGIQRRIDEAERALEREREAEDKRLEREARKAERAAKREEARRTREEAAAARRRRPDRPTWGSGAVECCDGTLSPTCTYGRSLRGCCSHHGGVC